MNITIDLKLTPFQKWLFTAKRAHNEYNMHVVEFYHMKWIESENK